MNYTEFNRNYGEIGSACIPLATGMLILLLPGRVRHLLRFMGGWLSWKLNISRLTQITNVENNENLRQHILY